MYDKIPRQICKMQRQEQARCVNHTYVHHLLSGLVKPFGSYLSPRWEEFYMLIGRINWSNDWDNTTVSVSERRCLAVSPVCGGDDGSGGQWWQQFAQHSPLHHHLKIPLDCSQWQNQLSWSVGSIWDASSPSGHRGEEGPVIPTVGTGSTAEEVVSLENLWEVCDLVNVTRAYVLHLAVIAAPLDIPRYWHQVADGPMFWLFCGT